MRIGERILIGVVLIALIIIAGSMLAIAVQQMNKKEATAKCPVAHNPAQCTSK